MVKDRFLFTGHEWNTITVEKLWNIIDCIGKKDLQLDYYPPQFDIVSFEQMLDAYSSVGMPIFYNHWSFGKNFVTQQKLYKKGKINLAYEMVINSNPCLAYLMEDNTACCTALVMAHANIGHASFFKSNYLFKQHTDPNSILDFLEYAKKFIFKCEEMHGLQTVESLIDNIHILSKFGVDKYPKTLPINEKEKQRRELDRIDTERKLYNKDFDTIPTKTSNIKKILQILSDKLFEEDRRHVIKLEEENILRVIYDHSILLYPWEKEIIRIIAKIEQYFYPQGQTKIMNEGWACFIHYYIMQQLYKQKYINEGAYLEFIKLHTSVCFQSGQNHLNPYALGFAIFTDLKRACENPDEEDYKWLKTIAGKKDWRFELKNIIKYYKDESFILQFLSPKVIRKFKLFSLKDDASLEHYEVTGIQNDEDIEHIRSILSKQNELDNRKPNFEVKQIDNLNNTMYIKYTSYKSREVNNLEIFAETIETLTGYTVCIGED